MPANQAPLPTNAYPAARAMLTIEKGFDAISKTWQGRGFYEEGSIVVFSGGLYICNADIDAPEYSDADNDDPRTDTVTWSPVSADGSILLYDSETVYNPGELVRSPIGDIWFSRAQSQGEPLEDGLNWFELSSTRWRSDSNGGTYNQGVIVEAGAGKFINLTGVNTDDTPDQDSTNWEDITPSIVSYYRNYGDSDTRDVANPATRVEFITETVQTSESSVQAIRLVIAGEEVLLPIGGSGGSELAFTDNHNTNISITSVPQYSVQNGTGDFDVSSTFQAAYLVQEQSSLGELVGTPQPDNISTITINSLTARVTAVPAGSEDDLTPADAPIVATIDSDTDTGNINVTLSDQYRGTYTITWYYDITRTSSNPNDVQSPQNIVGTDTVSVNIGMGTYATVTRSFAPQTANQFGSDGETDAITVAFRGIVQNGEFTDGPLLSDFAATQTGGTAIATDSFTQTGEGFSFNINNINTYVDNNLSVGWGGVSITSTGNYTGEADVVYGAGSITDTFNINTTAVSFSVAGMPTGIIDPFTLTDHTIPLSLSDTNLDHRNGDQSGPYDGGETASPIIYTENSRTSVDAFILSSDNHNTTYDATYNHYLAPTVATTVANNNWRFNYTDTRNTSKNSATNGSFSVGIYGYLVHVDVSGNDNAFFTDLVANAHTNGTPILGSSWSLSGITWSGPGNVYAGRTSYLIVPDGLAGPSRCYMRIDGASTSQNTPRVGGSVDKVSEVVFVNTDGSPFEYVYSVYLLFGYDSTLSAPQTVNGSVG